MTVISLNRDTRMKRLGIYGLGRLGLSLTWALYDAGLSPFTGSRNHARREQLPDDLKARWCDSLENLIQQVDTVILSVRDDAIAEVVNRISDILPEDRVLSFVHCSGALGTTVFEPLVSRGHRGGVFHPLNSFPDPMNGRTLFRGTWIGINTTGSELRNELHNLAHILGGHPLDLDDTIQPIYHLVAVLVANAPVVLAGWSRKLVRQYLTGSVPWEAYRPLIETACRSMTRDEPLQFLTGPWIRGDRETIHRHLQFLKDHDPEGHRVYQALTDLLTKLITDKS